MTYPMWNQGKTGILDLVDGHLTFLDSGPAYEALIETDIPDYTPTVDVAPTLSRSEMYCSPAQIRIALSRAGLLSVVQGIVDADAEASIVFEYALSIYRESPFITALNNHFTEEEVDAIFISAMGIVL